MDPLVMTYADEDGTRCRSVCSASRASPSTPPCPDCGVVPSVLAPAVTTGTATTDEASSTASP